MFGHDFQIIGMPFVIAIKQGYIFTASFFYPPIPSDTYALIFLMKYPYPVVVKMLLDYPHSIVSRSVIDYNDFKILILLFENRIQSMHNRMRFVVQRNDNRHHITFIILLLIYFDPRFSMNAVTMDSV